MAADVLARVHSSCVTGDIFHSARCDCGPQLHEALGRIADEGRGVLIYLNQEGRGIGLANKIRAYSLQDEGADTVEANERLGFAADLRDYRAALEMLRDLGVRSVRLMSNNPKKLEGLAGDGLAVNERLPIEIAATAATQHYLQTKKHKLGHHPVLGLRPTTPSPYSRRATHKRRTSNPNDDASATRVAAAIGALTEGRTDGYQRDAKANQLQDRHGLAAQRRLQRSGQPRPDPARGDEGVAHQTAGEHPPARLAEPPDQHRERERQERIDFHVEARSERAVKLRAARQPAIHAVEHACDDREPDGPPGEFDARAFDGRTRDDRGEDDARDGDVIGGAETAVDVVPGHEPQHRRS